METVALSDGDLRWMFPAESVTPELTSVIEQASQRLLDIAATLDQGRAGWTGRGLEFSLLPSGQRGLGGFAENGQVSFVAELLPPGVLRVRVVVGSGSGDCGSLRPRVRLRHASDRVQKGIGPRDGAARSSSVG